MPGIMDLQFRLNGAIVSAQYYGPTVQIEWGSSYHAQYYGPTVQIKWCGSYCARYYGPTVQIE